MTRIYSEYAYSQGPRSECWWRETCETPPGDLLESKIACDVAIVGGGFTGLNAALTLAKAGVDVALFEAEFFGFGASGRNGGFCCLGGARDYSNRKIDSIYGEDARRTWRQAEQNAVSHVADFIEQRDLQVDKHSKGEVWLAHRASDMAQAETIAAQTFDNYGVDARIIYKDDLRREGLSAGFHGAIETPIGFGLNPGKYLAGLVTAARDSGVRLYENAPIDGMRHTTGCWTLTSNTAVIAAEKVIIATNGYTSEHLPSWLAGRYLPTQSSIVLSRPLSSSEREAQGWTSRQMCYDSRNLLHYFRLLPDNRMLFGMRGGLIASAPAEARSKARVMRDFYRFFPKWSHVELTNYWSGFVSLSPTGFPFVGEIPDHTGLLCAMNYHGNGVAMGSYCGHLIAKRILGRDTSEIPRMLSQPPSTFPLGRARRALLPIAYLGFALSDI